MMPTHQRNARANDPKQPILLAGGSGAKMHMFFAVKFNCKEHAQEIAVNVVGIAIARTGACTLD